MEAHMVPMWPIISEPMAIKTLFVAMVLFCGCGQIQSSTIQSTVSGTPSNKLTEVRRLKHSTSVSALERPILDYMEKVGALDGSQDHVKYLLSEQDSFDFRTKISATEILLRSKFQYQVFNVTSEDGYITQLVRIINPLATSSKMKTPPVVMYAGQGVSSAAFLAASMGSHVATNWPGKENFPEMNHGVDRSLAITLANNGYDVWLIGARGSDSENRGKIIRQDGALSSRLESSDSAIGKFDFVNPKLDERAKFWHQFTNPQTYWSFSNDEIVRYEFKHQLDLVLRVAQQEKLTLITYSNGGFIGYAFASMFPEYFNNHIDTMVNIAPAVYINKWNLVLGTAGLLSSFGQPNSPLIDQNIESLARGFWFELCKSKVVRYTKCKIAVNLLYGFSDLYQTHLELKMFDYIGTPMSRASLRQTLQCAHAGRLQYYDYGPVGNMANYGKLTVPQYDLKRSNMGRVYILTGDRDSIVDEHSVKKLFNDCYKPPLKHIRVPGYNHLDMLAGWDVNERVNRPILELLDDRSHELLSRSIANDGASSQGMNSSHPADLPARTIQTDVSRLPVDGIPKNVEQKTESSLIAEDGPRRLEDQPAPLVGESTDSRVDPLKHETIYEGGDISEEESAYGSRGQEGDAQGDSLEGSISESKMGWDDEALGISGARNMRTPLRYGGNDAKSGAQSKTVDQVVSTKEAKQQSRHIPTLRPTAQKAASGQKPTGSS